MSTIKVSKVEPVTSGGDCIVNATNIVGNKNLIINGAMQVAQRGTSNTSTGYSTVDRFEISSSGTDEAITQAQHALTSSDTGPWEKGFRYSYHMTNGNQTNGLGATDSLAIKQKIEAQNIATSGWNYNSTSSYITISFWIRSSVAQNFHGYLKSQDTDFQHYAYETGSLTANTWTKITKTIPGAANITFNNDTGIGLIWEIVHMTGTDESGSVTLNQWAAWNGSARTPDATTTWWATNDATLEITGVQLEGGDVATAYEHRLYGDELAQCQRYFQIKRDGYCAGNGVGSTDISIGVPLCVPMRAAPSITQFNAHRSGNQQRTATIHTVMYDDVNSCTMNVRTSGWGSISDETVYNVNIHNNDSMFLDAEI